MPLLVLLLAALVLTACGGEESTTPIEASADRAEQASEGVDTKPEPEPPPPLLSDRAVEELERFTENAPGEVAIAISPLGEGEGASVGRIGGDRAWSTMKVPVLVTLLARKRGEGGLGPEQRSQAAAALQSSDNEAALALFESLTQIEGGLEQASAAIDSVLRRSGDGRTTVNTEPSPEGYSTFGQTEWPAEQANRFFRALAAGCLLPPEDTEYVLSLMQGVLANQRWGLGVTPVPNGASVAFKGGWGPEADGGYLVRQSGIVFDDEKGGYALSMITVPDDAGPGSFEAGQTILSDTARLVTEKVDLDAKAAVTCER
ncbi:MAG: serine hydrolase [Solirubrobacterales bacterium]